MRATQQALHTRPWKALCPILFASYPQDCHNIVMLTLRMTMGWGVGNGCNRDNHAQLH